MMRLSSRSFSMNPTDVALRKLRSYRRLSSSSCKYYTRAIHVGALSHSGSTVHQEDFKLSKPHMSS